MMKHQLRQHSPANINQVKFQIYKIEVSQINKPYYIYIVIVYNIMLHIIV